MPAPFGPDLSRWKTLALRVQARAPGAEEELVDLITPHIMALAAGRLKDREAALEVVQDTLLGILKALREGRLRQPEKLPAFIAATARNRINERLHEFVQSRAAIPLDEADGRLPSGDKVLRTAALEDAERRAIVEAAFEKLKGTSRQILVLTLVEGLKPGEIAARLNMKPEVVRNRKSRALRVIRRQVRKTLRKRGHENR